MHRTSDLHFEQQILPLFDYAPNEFARDQLIDLLTNMPQSIEEIYRRQGVLKGLLLHSGLFKPFSYSRVELLEVYGATMNNKNRQAFLVQGRFRKYIPWATIRRQQEFGKSVQIFSFFKRLSAFYFSALDVELFPDFFKEELRQMIAILSELELEKFRPQPAIAFFHTGQFISRLKRIDQLVRSGKMAQCWSTLFLFEAHLSIAKGIRRYHLQFPEFTGERILLEEFYHPLLKAPVKNSIAIDTAVTLLTGPNMSGKSTILKSLGLCVYLAHLGIAVPARKCEMIFYDSISIAIDLHDDIQSGYSHFMTEIMALKKIVEKAAQGRRCFAIFDELFRGTNDADALAISSVTVLGLAKFHGSCFFISTHLHQLREKVSLNHRVAMKYLECTLVNGWPVFTYQLREGWSDIKIGQLIFEREGIAALLRTQLP